MSASNSIKSIKPIRAFAANKPSPTLSNSKKPAAVSSISPTIKSEKVKKTSKQAQISNASKNKNTDSVSSTKSNTVKPSYPIYSYQVASTRNKKAALKTLDRLKKSLKIKNFTDFWINSVQLKTGKMVHRVMIGRFNKKSQAKALKSSFKKIREKPILKKLKATSY